MSDNLRIYNKLRTVPNEAKKSIEGGRLKGMTDISPMWRIKALTEQFGPCGVGWFYVIKEKKILEGANGKIAAFVDIDLYYKDLGEWSQPIPGTGGSMFVTEEKGSLHTNDECFKMALTDAISVAAKAIGCGADVYWDKDKTKYSIYGEKADNAEKIEFDNILTEYKAKVKQLKGSAENVQEYFQKRHGKNIYEVTIGELKKALKLVEADIAKIKEAI